MRQLLLALLLVPAVAFAADAAPAPKAEKLVACEKCAAHAEKCADCTTAKAAGKAACAKCLEAAKACADCKKAAEAKPADKPAAK